MQGYFLKKAVVLLLCAGMLICALGGCGKKMADSETAATTAMSTTATAATTTLLTTTATTTATKATATKATAKSTAKVTQPSTPLALPNQDAYESVAQQAVIETALSYLARGSRIQYADTRLATGDIVPPDVRYRWERGKNSPEDATTQLYAYTNCAAFTYDVYYHGLGYDILSYTTASLIEKGQDEMVLKYYPTGNETVGEMIAFQERFRNTLKMGDIVVVRYNGSRKGNGHAMLYVGSEVLKNVTAEKNDGAEGNYYTSSTSYGYDYDMIHSGGGNYNYGQQKETFENNGSISMTSVDMLFDPTSSRYVFSKLISIGIVRPLNTFSGEVPQETVNRIQNLHGIVAEKLSDHTIGMTVNPGGEMTFTFALENQTGKAKTLSVRDVVPANTTYLSGAQKVSGRVLSWSVIVPAHGKARVSYKVRVNANTPYGTYIVSDSGSVGGVSTVCPSVMVAKTLTTQQQASLLTVIGELEETELEGADLLNAIYKKAFGVSVLPDSTLGVLEKTFMSYLGLPDYFAPNNEGLYAKMMVPTMYGGRYTMPEFAIEEVHVRTRLPYADQLMVGDILIAANTEGDDSPVMYLLAGDTAYNLLDGMKRERTNLCLERVLGYTRFAILRPSFVME